MPTLTLEYIKAETGEFDEESVFQAILTKRSISLIDAVNKCCNLRWLDLSQNQIIRMENLDGLAQLTSLDLSHNKIQKVQHLDGMPNLERLKLKANPISRIEDIEGLRVAHKLRHLHFQNVDCSDFCPICLKPEYRRTIREMLPDLFSFDSKRKHLPDLDKEVANIQTLSEVELAEPEPWFSKDDLDFDGVQSAEMLAADLQPQVDAFEAALRDCQATFAEASEVLKLQDVAPKDPT